MKSHNIWMLSDSVYKTESGFKDALNLYIKNKNFNRSQWETQNNEFVNYN